MPEQILVHQHKEPSMYNSLLATYNKTKLASNAAFGSARNYDIYPFATSKYE